jgi:hypothetical protein
VCRTKVHSICPVTNRITVLSNFNEDAIIYDAKTFTCHITDKITCLSLVTEDANIYSFKYH